jgi:hypothetical protein
MPCVAQGTEKRQDQIRFQRDPFTIVELMMAGVTGEPLGKPLFLVFGEIRAIDPLQEF